jgi:hypothetical protein
VADRVSCSPDGKRTVILNKDNYKIGKTGQPDYGIYVGGALYQGDAVFLNDKIFMLD